MAQNISALRGFLREIRITADANGRTIIGEIESRLSALYSGGDGRSIASTSSGSKSVSFSQSASNETASANLSYLLDIAIAHTTDTNDPGANATVEAAMRDDDRLFCIQAGDSFRTDFSTCRYS